MTRGGGDPGAAVLSRRVLNRTLLARQGLLARFDATPAALVERLVGLQAQEPPDPYVGLWSRIDGFDPASLAALLADRAAVRIGLMRTTLHLVTARDCRALYPVMRDVLVRAFRSSPFAKALDGADLEPILAAGREALVERPHTPADLGRRLAERWPDRDPTALAYACRFLLPLVQVPPRGLWGRTGRATNTTAEAWLGGPLDTATEPDEAVLRYLAAFGPATAADIRTWSWLTGLRPVVERLRPRLRSFRDEAGRELLDVEDGILLDGDEPAPPRLLPQFDNAFLSHATRERIVGDRAAGTFPGWTGPVLVDGFIDGAWRVRRERSTATMTLELYGAHPARTRRAVVEEAERLLGFVAADATARELTVVDG